MTSATVETMIAFHGDPKIKELFLTRVRAHRAADELIQGATVGRRSDGSFVGCAVVCTMETYSHAAYEAEIGVPRLLAKLEDGIFEGLDHERAMAWPEEFLSAIPVGADLSGVWPRFAVWLLADEDHGVIRHARGKKASAAIRRVAELYQQQIDGVIVDRDDWIKARSDDADADAAAA